MADYSCGNRGLFQFALQLEPNDWHGWVPILDPFIIGTILDIPRGLAFHRYFLSRLSAAGTIARNWSARLEQRRTVGRFHFSTMMMARDVVRIRPVVKTRMLSI